MEHHAQHLEPWPDSWPPTELDFDQVETPSEDDFVDAAFAALPEYLRDEQALLGALLWRPELHERLQLSPGEFADPLHGRIYGMARGLWRMRRHASAVVVADALWHITPMLKAGDRMTLIETLVFDTLGWIFPEYVISLGRNGDYDLVVH